MKQEAGGVVYQRMSDTRLSTRAVDDGSLFFTGVLENLEILVRFPNERLNPALTFCAVPDGMEGICGRGETADDAVDALVRRMLELLRSPPDLFDALAAGAQEIGNLHAATSTPGDGDDKDTWNMYATSTAYRSSAHLMRASAYLARLDAGGSPVLDRSGPPPGYGVFEYEFDDETLWVFQQATEAPPEGYRGRRSADRSKVIAWAWEHFNDRKALAERAAVKPGG